MPEGELSVVNSDLTKCVEGLNAKQSKVSTLWDYYKGRHILRWALSRLEEVFQNQQVNFVQNWSAVVVESMLERIELARFDMDEEAKTKKLSEMFTEKEGFLEAHAVHEEVLVVGEGFLVAGTGADGDVELYQTDAANMFAQYDPERPREMVFASKWWVVDDGVRLNIYYPDRIDYYHKKGKQEAGTKVGSKGWVPYVSDATGDGSLTHDFPGIPVFHFRRDRKLSPEILNVIPIQDAINKLLADMMVASEFAAFPQRWIISQAENDGKVPYGSYSTLEIPAGDGESQGSAAGSFPAADLGNFLKAVESKAHAIGIISRTPKHYFLAQGGTPSGEALIAMEAPLVKKVNKVIANMIPTWRRVAQFLLESTDDKVTPVFLEAATSLPVTVSGTRKTDVEAGIPLITTLKRAGWTEDEIEAMKADTQSPDTQEGTTDAPQSPVTSPKEGQTLAAQAAGQEAQVAAQAVAIKDSLAQALEAITVAQVDKLVTSGALDRLRKPKDEPAAGK